MRNLYSNLLLALIAFLIAGCAAPVKVSTIQEKCEAQYPQFPDIVKCTRTNLLSAYPASASDASAKLYFLKGEELSEKLAKGQITNIQAKTQWQELFVQLKTAEDTGNANASANSINTYNAIRPKQTTCRPNGIGGTTCSTY
jgi:hypothetical protein